MNKVKAYHAGELKDIETFISWPSPYKKSQVPGDWLGYGIYFWENDIGRAERWQMKKGLGAILECEIDTSNLLNILELSAATKKFYESANKQLKSYKNPKPNNKQSQLYFLDCKLFNDLKKQFEHEYSGFRMAFHLGDSITPDGNIYQDQHIQICLWETSAILNPSKYIPSLL